MKNRSAYSVREQTTCRNLDHKVLHFTHIAIQMSSVNFVTIKSEWANKRTNERTVKWMERTLDWASVATSCRCAASACGSYDAKIDNLWCYNTDIPFDLLIVHFYHTFCLMLFLLLFLFVSSTHVLIVGMVNHS